jgi:ABC-type transporter Mla MlaB component
MNTAMSPVTIFVNEGTGVSVTGTLDVTTVGYLNRAVSDFFRHEHAADLDVLELDLSTVTICDETALAAVRHARAVCTERAVALRVVPSEAVRQVMCPRV